MLHASTGVARSCFAAAVGGSLVVAGLVLTQGYACGLSFVYTCVITL